VSLHTSPAAHDRNTPDTWRAVKVGERSWSLVDGEGHTLDQGFRTRAAAEEAITSGTTRNLYEQEGRWYAGDTPAGWRPWSEVDAERVRWEARNGRPAPWVMA
jgi:hypothetical protein